MSVGKLDHVFAKGDVLDQLIDGFRFAPVLFRNGLVGRSFFFLGQMMASPAIIPIRYRRQAPLPERKG